MKIYAVKEGRKSGIFNTWKECEDQVKGFSGALYHSFKLKEEALEYLSPSSKMNTTSTNSLVESNQVESTNIPLESSSLFSEKGELIGYCDGSYIEKCGGYGYLIITQIGENIKGSGRAKTSIGIQNNQVSELIALDRLLYHLKLLINIYVNDRKIYFINIFTDSEYTVKCINEYIYIWMENGWKTSMNEDVKHKDIICLIFDRMQFFKNKNIDLQISHIYGHRKDKNKIHNYYNNIVDQLAKEGTSLIH